MQTTWNPQNAHERSHSADMSITAWMQSGYIGVSCTKATYRYIKYDSILCVIHGNTEPYERRYDRTRWSDVQASVHTRADHRVGMPRLRPPSWPVPEGKWATPLPLRCVRGHVLLALQGQQNQHTRGGYVLVRKPALMHHTHPHSRQQGYLLVRPMCLCERRTPPQRDVRRPDRHNMP